MERKDNVAEMIMSFMASKSFLTQQVKLNVFLSLYNRHIESFTMRAVKTKVSKHQRHHKSPENKPERENLFNVELNEFVRKFCRVSMFHYFVRFIK